MNAWPHLDALSKTAQAIHEEKDRLFTDKSDGFTFDKTMWRNMHVSDRHRYVDDARAHRDEAHRRKIVCRLESREKETAHWLSQQRFLEKLYKLEPIE